MHLNPSESISAPLVTSVLIFLCFNLLSFFPYNFFLLFVTQHITSNCVWTNATHVPGTPDSPLDLTSWKEARPEVNSKQCRQHVNWTADRNPVGTSDTKTKLNLRSERTQLWKARKGFWWFLNEKTELLVRGSNISKCKGRSSEIKQVLLMR